jgi:hypothetical protein
MSLEKVVLRCFRPLSLSLTSLLFRPVFIQGSGRVARPPLALARGRRVHLSEEASPGGRGASRLFSRGGGKLRGVARHRVAASPTRMWAGGGTERAASFGLRAPCPGRTHLGPFTRRTPGRRQDWRWPVRRLQILFFCVDTLCPLIPVAFRGRLPVL